MSAAAPSPDGASPHRAHLVVNGFKGVELSLSLKPMTILFGRNGAGKTNILEAYASVLGWEIPARRSPEDAPPSAESVGALVHGGDALLQSYLTLDLDSGAKLDSLASSVISAFRHKELVVPVDTLEVMVSRLRRGILRELRSICLDWPRIRSAYIPLLDEWLASRWFFIRMRELTWLYPPPWEWTDETRERLELISDASDAWPANVPPVLLGWVELFEHGNCEEAYLEGLALGEDYTGLWRRYAQWEQPLFAPVSVLRYGSLPDNPTAFLERVSSAVRTLATAAWRLQDEDDGTEESSSERLDASSADEAEGEDDPGRLVDDVHRELAKAKRLAAHQAWWSSDEAFPWLQRDDEGWWRIHPWIEEACSALSRAINSIAPPPVRNEYELLVEPTSPGLLAEGRSRVRLRARSTRTGTDWDLDVLGAATRTWAYFAIEYVLHTVEHASNQSAARAVILDEPERHLHPVGQREVAEWLMEQLGGEESAHSIFVVATHSPEFLNLRVDTREAEFVGVRRDPDGSTQVDVISSDLLGALRDADEEMGVDIGDVRRLSRIVLVVEGTHDVLVLQRFFGEQLKRERVLLLPLSGAFNLGTPLVEFLAQSGKRVRILFDNVRAEALSADPGKGLRSEEAKLRKVLAPLRALTTEPGLDVGAVAFDLPDIAYALPDAAVQQLSADLGGDTQRFDGLASIAARYRQTGSKTPAKAYLLRQLGLGQVNDKTLVPSILARAQADSRPSPLLERAVEEALRP